MKQKMMHDGFGSGPILNVAIFGIITTVHTMKLPKNIHHHAHFLKNGTLNCPNAQPKPAAAVHCTCSVATLRVGLKGTNFPSNFVPKIKSVHFFCVLNEHIFFHSKYEDDDYHYPLVS